MDDLPREPYSPARSASANQTPKVMPTGACRSWRVALRPPLKRTLDHVLAALVLAYLAPLLCLAALALYLVDGGPILVRRQRVGRHGREFGLLRFRTADESGCPTLVGIFLRATRIDSLPSLLNVLRGEMSLVGPRPATPAELAMLTVAAIEHYASVRPGLTGPWRLAGFSSDVDEAGAGGGHWAFIRLDLPYVLAPSLRADLRILLGTCGMAIGLR